jgi:hypothetical protein
MRTGEFLNRGNILRALLVVALYTVYAVQGAIDSEPEAPATCATDSDCMQQCPPPNDDPDCDGGPESEQ